MTQTITTVDLTKIPKPMRVKGWTQGAILLETWFSKPSFLVPQPAPITYAAPDERKMPKVLEPSKQRRQHIGNRIGHLLPTHTDHWWSISKEDDIPVITSEVVAALHDYGIPYLESVATLQGVAELSGLIPGFKRRPTRVRAAALELLGRNSEAQEVRRELSSRVKTSSNDCE